MDPWTIVYIVVLVISIATRPKPKTPKPAILSDFEFPQIEENTPQSVVFGDVWVPDWFVLGVGNFRTKAIKK